MPKPSPSALQSYQQCTVQIYQNEACTDHLGTGFLINANHVVTCQHVLDSGAEWVKLAESPTALQFDTVDKHDSLDLAVIELKNYDRQCSGVPLVEGVDEHIIKELLSENCGCYGHKDLRTYNLGKHKSDTDDTSPLLQLDGAPQEGFSGSPVLLSNYPDYGVFGMVFLGGEYAGQSRIVRSDAIIEWLRSLKQPELVPKTVYIDEVLRRIAFGDRDWSRVVRNQWLSMWGYARNKDGEYVGRDGVTPLKDHQGRPIVVFNEETEIIVRDQGLNTGSIEYAKLYDADPDRFGASETDEEIVQEARERMGIEDRS